MADLHFFKQGDMRDSQDFAYLDLSGLQIYEQKSDSIWAGYGEFGSGIDLRYKGSNLGTSAAIINEATSYYNGQVSVSFSKISWDQSLVSRVASAPGEALNLLLGGDDKIYGSDYSDYLMSAGGNDQMFGFRGNDIMFGNRGSDYIAGFEGDDTAYGGQDRDEIYGNQGNDLLFGNFADDIIYGGQGSDRIYGGQDQDQLYGNLQDDIIYGNRGNDVLYGGQNNDQLFGGDGNDRLDGNRDNDTLTGGPGADSFVLSAGQDVIKDFNLGEGDRIVLRYGDNPNISDSSSGLNIGVGDRNARLEGWTLASFNSEAAFTYI